MKYDFIEIGTANFDTLIENATDETVGMSIEPVLHYFNQLPNKKNVKKINCAISFDNDTHDLDVYYVPENLIKYHNLPGWLAGCNSIGKIHPSHQGLESIVATQRTTAIPIKKLFEDNDVSEVDYLKIDTEGGDCDILLCFMDYLKSMKKSMAPKKIKFENNALTPKEKLAQVLNLYFAYGYTIEFMGGDDLIMVLGK